MEKLGNFLGVTDYVIIILSLVACTGVGIYHRFRPGTVSKIEEYFLGSRKMTILPIAISLVATSMSAVPIVSGMGEMYRYGIEYAFLSFGLQSGRIVAAYTIIPVFRYLNYVSIYEYFERRFDRSVRLGFAAAYIVMNVFQAAVVLYLPTLLLATVTEVPYWVMATFSGVTCTIYCILGGFKTVVWTDVIQFSLMMISMVAVIWCGTVTASGPAFIWKTAFVDTFFRNIQWMDSSTKRFSAISSMIFGIFMSMQLYATNQAIIQRVLSVRNIKAAQRSIIITAILGWIFTILLTGGAAVIYANFYLCDPMQRQKETGVTSMDLVLLYFVQVFLSIYPGLSGVVIAGILSSSLSTISSFINAFAAIALEDFIRPCFTQSQLSEKKAIFISKFLTAVFGLSVTLLSFLIPYMGGALKAFLMVMGAIGGPMAGLVFLAMFLPRAEKKACVFGMLVAIAFCLWLSVGSSMYRIPQQSLPLSTESCPNRTDSFSFESLNNETFSYRNVTRLQTKTGYIFPMYKISFVWYGPMGILLTFVVGAVLSYAQKKNTAHVDSNLLSPMVKMWRTHSLVPQQEKEIPLETTENKNHIKDNLV